jgi:hypothetical protein
MAEESEYEQLRRRNIARNNSTLIGLGLVRRPESAFLSRRFS